MLECHWEHPPVPLRCSLDARPSVACAAARGPPHPPSADVTAGERAQSRCRCGRGEPSPGADLGKGEPSFGADVAVRHAPAACAAARGPSLGSSCSASTRGPRARSPCLHATPPSVHQGTARHGMARHATARYGMAQYGMAWHGMAQYGMAWHGTRDVQHGAARKPVPLRASRNRCRAACNVHQLA